MLLNNKVMKLHLGCGDKILEGYINVDIRDNLLCDYYCDVRSMDGFELGIADEIYASHVLEHFSRREYYSVLKKWSDILKPGGIIKLSVPNLEAVFEAYYEGYELKTLWGLLYGGQTYENNYHFVGFDYKTLKKDLEEIGFTDVSTWDWRLTNHSHVDDYSQCYLPHMDKQNGKLMSLNIQAVKK